MVSAEQISFFKQNGYLVVRDFFSEGEVESLQTWAQEVHDYKPTEESEFVPYEEVNDKGERVLCRTENFVDGHAGFNRLLRGDKLLDLLDALAGEPMLLFKEKINYKLSGSGQLLIFTSYLAHRSGANRSRSDRKAIYATYNCAREGDMHQQYYEHRKEEWPPTHMRRRGVSYEEGAKTYAFGSPMLSVDAGHQVVF